MPACKPTAATLTPDQLASVIAVLQIAFTGDISEDIDQVVGDVLEGKEDDGAEEFAAVTKWAHDYDRTIAFYNEHVDPQVRVQVSVTEEVRKQMAWRGFTFLIPDVVL